MALMDIKATLRKMAEGGNEIDRFAAEIYLHEIEAAKIDVAEFVVETKKSSINYLLKKSSDIVSVFVGEYCKAVEIEPKTGKNILLVYLTPIDEM